MVLVKPLRLTWPAAQSTFIDLVADSSHRQNGVMDDDEEVVRRLIEGMDQYGPYYDEVFWEVSARIRERGEAGKLGPGRPDLLEAIGAGTLGVRAYGAAGRRGAQALQLGSCTPADGPAAPGWRLHRSLASR